jgi:hypothetical protein
MRKLHDSAFVALFISLLLGLSACKKLENFVPQKVNESALREVYSMGTDTVIAFYGVETSSSYRDSRNWLYIPLGHELREHLNHYVHNGDERVAEIEQQLNHAAHACFVEMGPIIKQDIARIEVKNALIIVKGSDDAGRQYLQDQYATTLRTKMLPVVQRHMNEVDIDDEYHEFADQLNHNVGFHVLDTDGSSLLCGALVSAYFSTLSRVEYDIRHEASLRNSDNLKQAFGQ